MKLLIAINQFKDILANAFQEKIKPELLDFYHKKRRLVYFVIIPIIVFGFYILIVASNRWVSESKITVKNISSTKTDISALGFIIGDLNSPATQDLSLLKEYVYSYDMFEYLDKNTDLRTLYRKGVWDPSSRLFSWSSKEDAFSYYKSKVSLVLEENSRVLTISTQGFKPKYAKKINDAILERSEWFLNEISHKIAKDETLFLEKQIKQAAKRMNEAQKAIISFQVENNIINPSTQIEFGTRLISNLMRELAVQETELKALEAYLSDNAPQIISIKSKITALKDQINKEGKLVAGGDDFALNTISLKFQDLEIEAKLAEQLYKATTVALEKNRLDSSKKFKSLVIISSPTLPEKPLFPKRLYNLLVFSIVIGATYGVAILIITSIKEHI